MYSAFWRSKHVWSRILLLGIISVLVAYYFQTKTANVSINTVANVGVLQEIDENILAIHLGRSSSGDSVNTLTRKQAIDKILNSTELLLNGAFTAKTYHNPIENEIIRSKLYDFTNLLRSYRAQIAISENVTYEEFLKYQTENSDKEKGGHPLAISKEDYNEMVTHFFKRERANSGASSLLTRITAIFSEIKLDHATAHKKDLVRLGMWRTGSLLLLALFFSYQAYQIIRKFILLDASETNLKESIDTDREKLESNIAFAEEIGEGNLESEFEPDEDDPLGEALRKMRSNLLKVAESDNQRNWSNEGITLFGELLRSNTSGLEELSAKIIQELVKYLDANQGSVFIINDEDDTHPILELKSCYAWGKIKFAQKTIEMGEGLVGQAWQESDCIYVTDVPDNYIEITSGLGKANPTAILVIPLKVNDEIYGIIEVATFEDLPEYKIDFMNKLAEMLASSFATTKVNSTTQELLKESQRKEEELRAAEEETRQNLEELQATQEEMDRLRSQLESQLTVMDKVAIISKTDPLGNITYANDLFCEEVGYEQDEIIGQNHRIFKSGHQDDKIFKELWSTISAGNQWRGEIKNKAKDGSFHWEDSIISPITNKEGELIEYIAVRFPINEKKANEERMHEMNVQMENEKSKNLAVLEGAVDGVISFDNTGKIEFFNKAAEDIWSMERRDAVGKGVDILFPVKVSSNGQGNKVEFTGNGEAKQIDVRTEITTKDSIGEEINILATLSEANIEGEHFYTLFVQNISVDLF